MYYLAPFAAMTTRLVVSEACNMPIRFSSTTGKQSIGSLYNEFDAMISALAYFVLKPEGESKPALLFSRVMGMAGAVSLTALFQKRVVDIRAVVTINVASAAVGYIVNHYFKVSPVYAIYV